MYHIRRNKSELIVLTGAIYSFVAYLTAFTLEILFLIDLTRRSNEIMSTFSTQTTTTPIASLGPGQVASLAPNNIIGGSGSSSGSSSSNNIINNQDEQQTTATLLDRFNFETMQAHITVSCLTISILYFVVFITSLALIVALILHSTFMLLIWMCAMTTMYLPEFGLVIYVSVYSWGLDTRNGQTELIFYLFRAVLNIIFVYRARKLFKQWNYEKNFFRLKSGSTGAFSTGSQQFGGHSSPYDSPYFIGRASSCGVGDSLSTTINPIFTSSTLNLNCYDFVRDQYNQHGANSAPGASSRTTSPTTVSSSYGVASSDAICDNSNNNNTLLSASRGRLTAALSGPALYSRARQAKGPNGTSGEKLTSNRLSYNNNHQYDNNTTSGSVNYLPQAHNKGIRQFYLGDGEPDAMHRLQQHHRQLSLLSIDDNFPDYELDIDYRTLGKSAGKQRQQHSHNTSREHVASSQQGQSRNHQQPTTTGHRFNPQLDDHHNYDRDPRQHRNRQQQQQATSPASVRMQLGSGTMTRAQDDSAYSTRSLDRRSLKDFSLNEQVVLRPLEHQPFEYLQRPGSTTNLNYN